MVYKGKLPKSRKATPFKHQKPRISITETANKRCWRHTSTTTAPRTRSFQHHMDEPIDSICDRDLWSDGMEDILIDMLYQETLMDTLRGGKITHGNHIRFTERLSVIGPKNFNSDQVKGKIARLKRRQQEFTDLMKQTGLGWDPERKALVASEERWVKAIRVRSSFKHFKIGGCPKYELFCVIFGCLVVTGTLHRASTDLSPTSDDEQMLEEDMRNRG